MVVMNDGTGTRLKNDGSRSHLDLTFISNNLAAKCRWIVHDENWNSDHFPTFISVNERPSIEHSQSQRFSFTKADWASFSNNCRFTIDDAVLDPSIHISARNISEAIMKAAEQNIPEKKFRGKKSVPHWNDECKRSVQDKRKAQKKMEKTRNLEDCIHYRQLKAISQRTIKASQKTHWETFCSSINTTTKSSTVWNMVKVMAGNGSSKNIPSIKDGDKIHLSNKEKAEAFSISFAKNSSTENLEKPFLDRRDRIDLTSVPPPHLENHPINDPLSMFELESAIRMSKINSSPGEDGICYEMIKQIPRSCKETILTLLNRIWKEGIIPESWKHSIVLPILKPGKESTILNSYRPIALTDALCKINELIIAPRLNWYMEKNRLYNSNQSGFRKNRSCLDQIMRLQSEIENSINTRKFTVGIFLDFTKAYDMLWIEGLIHKIINLDIGGNMIRWIRNFLTDRTIQVRVGDALSGTKKIENGIPQGSVISPILFLLMINDIPRSNDGTSTDIFADDTALWKSGNDLERIISQMQINLNNVRDWCATWGFMLSKEKTIAVIFTHRLVDNSSRLKIDGTGIQWKNEVRFLGVIFDKRMTWKQHIDYITDANRCKKRINMMRCISGQSRGADKRWLMHIYTAMIQSIIDYGSPAYISASNYLLGRLDSLQAHALRICCGAMKGTPSSALQVECGDQPLELRRESLLLKLVIKVKASPDHPANKILQKVKRMRKDKITVETRTRIFLNDQVHPVQGPTDPENPPWRRKRGKVVTSLKDKINKEISPEFAKIKSIEMIEKYEGATRCYTDASINNGRAGAAFYIQDGDIRKNFRLSGVISIFSAEMVAIREVLREIKTSKLRNPVIFSDSLGHRIRKFQFQTQLVE